MKARLLVLAALLGLAGTAAAQDMAAPTDDDRALLEECLARDEAAAGPDICIGTAADACMALPEGETTVGMSECSLREATLWDERLNARYAELEGTLEPEVFAMLREAQRAWIAYRDAECAFAHALWSPGTISSVVAAGCMLDQTARRAIALEGVGVGE